jgi:hypothetical protein
MALSTFIYLSLLQQPFVKANELVFVDVASDDKIDLSTLDVPVEYSRGINNFFASDPMYTHDWADLSDVRKNLGAVFSLSQQKAGQASVFQEYEAAFAVTYHALPKNSEGLLTMHGARYALYRFFDKKRGWQLKGLEPAGGSWLETVEMDPSVKQTSKFMVPTVLINDIMGQMGTRGVTLHQLAIVAMTMEHAIRSEMLLYLYKIYRTLGLPLEGKRNEEEVNSILSTYLMVFAFGVNLDVSTRTDIVKARMLLDSKHHWWHDLQNFIAEELQADALSRRGPKQTAGDLDFFELLNVTLRIGEHYSNWQRRDCSRAKDQLSPLAEASSGRIAFTDWGKLPQATVKPFFTEDAERLRYFNAMDESQRENPKVIMPNYLNSKSMCLTTASYYMVCCSNDCENYLDRLRAVGSPELTPNQIKEVLQGLLPERLDQDTIWSELKGFAEQQDGKIALHGFPFAQWLHKAFPIECPAPNPFQHDGSVLRNPKTVNEWLHPESDNSTEILQMGHEVGERLRSWEVKDLESSQEELFPEDEEPEPVLTISESPKHDATPPSVNSVLGMVRAAAFVIMLISALGAAVFMLVNAMKQDNGKQCRVSLTVDASSCV